MATLNSLQPDLLDQGRKIARFWFSPGLNVFLTKTNQGKEIKVYFKGSQSAKHLIESMGIPHTEIGVLTANNKEVNLNYPVQDNDFIEVFSAVEAPQGKNHFPADFSANEVKFILDNHLGKLTNYLRMLGFDCLYDSVLQDRELAEISSSTHRFLLTRDRRLLMRKIVTEGYFVRSKQPLQQAIETINRFSLQGRIEPFKRCLRCNHLLVPVEKETILHRLESKTRLYFHTFKICSSCGQVYWQGSHYERMCRTIETILKEQ